MTVLKPQSTLVTGTAAGDTDPGLEIQFGPSAPLGQSALIVQDWLAAPIFFVTEVGNGFSLVWGDYIGAYADFLTPGSFVGVDGVRNPPCVVFPDGTSAQGARLWSGTGAPSTSTIGGAAAVGDVYLRRDTPTVANQRVYHCTAASPTAAAATTANVTRSGTQTVDGVALVVGDRVLVKNQTAAAQNGLFVVASGAWTRDTAMDAGAEFVGASVWVTGGSQAGTAWTCQNTVPPTVDTTAITFAQTNGAPGTWAGRL